MIVHLRPSDQDYVLGYSLCEEIWENIKSIGLDLLIFKEGKEFPKTLGETRGTWVALGDNFPQFYSGEHLTAQNYEVG